MVLTCPRCGATNDVDVPAGHRPGRTLRMRCAACGQNVALGDLAAAAVMPPSKTEAVPAVSTAATQADAQASRVVAIEAQEDMGARWPVPEEATLLRWILQGRVLPDDIGIDAGGARGALGERAELTMFFEAARSLTGVLADAVSGALPEVEEAGDLVPADLSSAFEDVTVTTSPAEAESAEPVEAMPPPGPVDLTAEPGVPMFGSDAEVEFVPFAEPEFLALPVSAGAPRAGVSPFAGHRTIVPEEPALDEDDEFRPLPELDEAIAMPGLGSSTDGGGWPVLAFASARGEATSPTSPGPVEERATVVAPSSVASAREPAAASTGEVLDLGPLASFFPAGLDESPPDVTVNFSTEALAAADRLPGVSRADADPWAEPPRRSNAARWPVGVAIVLALGAGATWLVRSGKVATPPVVPAAELLARPSENPAELAAGAQEPAPSPSAPSSGTATPAAEPVAAPIATPAVAPAVAPAVPLPPAAPPSTAPLASASVPPSVRVNPPVSVAAAPRPAVAVAAPTSPRPAAPTRSAKALVDEGWKNANAGNFDAAKASFSDAVGMGGGWSALYGRGYATEKLGDQGGAVADYCRALAAGPSSDMRGELEAFVRRLGRTCP
jgi:hypothetical protein